MSPYYKQPQDYSPRAPRPLKRQVRPRSDPEQCFAKTQHAAATSLEQAAVNLQDLAAASESPSNITRPPVYPRRRAFGTGGTFSAAIGGITRTVGGIVGSFGRSIGGNTTNIANAAPVSGVIAAAAENVDRGAYNVARGSEGVSPTRKRNASRPRWDRRRRRD